MFNLGFRSFFISWGHTLILIDFMSISILPLLFLIKFLWIFDKYFFIYNLLCCLLIFCLFIFYYIYGLVKVWIFIQSRNCLRFRQILIISLFYVDVFSYNCIFRICYFFFIFSYHYRISKLCPGWKKIFCTYIFRVFSVGFDSYNFKRVYRVYSLKIFD